MSHCVHATIVMAPSTCISAITRSTSSTWPTAANLDLDCHPCPRTRVTHLSGPYRRGLGELCVQPPVRRCARLKRAHLLTGTPIAATFAPSRGRRATRAYVVERAHAPRESPDA